MKKLGICVPYRNRESQLKEFIPRISEFLDGKDIDYTIVVCNQADDKKFNRGKLKNVAFDYAKKLGCDYFAFHDIDLIPEDDSCDYSYPEEGPLLLSKYLSRNDYKPLYPEHFGGVVIFSKEQFEDINGYYNEYWDWGVEDDDLFYRCQQEGYSIKTNVSENYKNNSIANLNGDNSLITINSSDTLKKLFLDDFTILMLVKAHPREDVPRYLIGDDEIPFLTSPILSRYGLPQMSYVNTLAYQNYFYNSKNESKYTWLARELNDWSVISFSHNKKKKEVYSCLNGRKIGNGFEATYEGLGKDYYNAPIFLGYNDHPSWYCNGQNYFKGDFACCAMWNRELSLNELESITANYKNIPEENLLLHYDFENSNETTVFDQSGNENHGKMQNVEIKTEDIGELLHSNLPYSRPGTYECIPHENEGYDKNNKFKQRGSSLNEKIFYNEVKTGNLSYKSCGVNNLEYKVVSSETINDKHIMINVNI